LLELHGGHSPEQVGRLMRRPYPTDFSSHAHSMDQSFPHVVWIVATHVRSTCCERPDLIAIAVLGCFVKSLLGIRQRPAQYQWMHTTASSALVFNLIMKGKCTLIVHIGDDIYMNTYEFGINRMKGLWLLQ